MNPGAEDSTAICVRTADSAGYEASCFEWRLLTGRFREGFKGGKITEFDIKDLAE